MITWQAAPVAMISSGFKEVRILESKNSSVIIWRIFGILVDPPTNMT